MAKRTFNIGDFLKEETVPKTGQREQIEYFPLEKIIPDERNPYSLENLEELAANIETVGLQQPLRVRPGEGGSVIVISGHRRRAACLMIRDGGNDMFRQGVPCIVERGDGSAEFQELKIIFANSSTRVLSAAELSMQAVKVRELLYKLKDQGYNFPGRMRDYVAKMVNSSSSKVGRLLGIRERLVPELLEEFDAGRLGETVADLLAQEDAGVQRDLAARLGPAVRSLSIDSAQKVLGQIKQPLVTAPPEPDPNKAIDSLKRYLDEREKEDREFWKLMQRGTADSLILQSFSAGAAPMRKDNIDMLRTDARNSSVWTSTEHWTASNKGLAIGPGEKITRTWTEVYDAVAAIAISRWRQVLVDERNKRNVKLKAGVSDSGTVEAAWQTGTPPRAGRYYARIDMGDGGTHEAVGEYRGGSWSVFGGPLYEKMKVVGWWPLPEK